MHGYSGHLQERDDFDYKFGFSRPVWLIIADNTHGGQARDMAQVPCGHGAGLLGHQEALAPAVQSLSRRRIRRKTLRYQGIRLPNTRWDVHPPQRPPRREPRDILRPEHVPIDISLWGKPV